MIVDTSALVAIVVRESQADELITTLTESSVAGIGTPTIAELGLVLSSRLDSDPHDVIVRLLDEFDITEVPFGADHWREAVEAHRRFGRGRHKAKLNFGDCMTYAVASLANEPLLFVGDDFSATDLQVA